MHETKKTERPRKSRNKDNEKMSIVSSSQASLAVVPQGHLAQSLVERFGSVCFSGCGRQLAIARQHHVATSKRKQHPGCKRPHGLDFGQRLQMKRKTVMELICVHVGALGCARITDAMAHTKNMLNQYLNNTV